MYWCGRGRGRQRCARGMRRRARRDYQRRRRPSDVDGYFVLDRGFRRRCFFRRRFFGRRRSRGYFCRDRLVDHDIVGLLLNGVPTAGFGLHAANDPQIRGTGGRGQRAGIRIPGLGQDGIGLVFGGKRAEPQAVARAPIFGHLNLIDMRLEAAAGERLGRQVDRRGRDAEIDDEGPVAAETRCLLHRLKQVLDAEMPDLACHWRVYRRCHKSLPRNGTGAQDIDEEAGMKA